MTVGDIDPTNMRVHIRDSKGNKDRLVPLPTNTLHILKNFWRLHRHPTFIFPSRKKGLKNTHLVDMPLDRGGIQAAMKRVVEQLGIKKDFMPFTPALCRARNNGECGLTIQFLRTIYLKTLPIIITTNYIMSSAISSSCRPLPTSEPSLAPDLHKLSRLLFVLFHYRLWHKLPSWNSQHALKNPGCR